MREYLNQARTLAMKKTFALGTLFTVSDHDHWLTIHANRRGIQHEVRITHALLAKSDDLDVLFEQAIEDAQKEVLQAA